MKTTHSHRVRPVLSSAVPRRKGRFSCLAILAAAMLTLGTISCSQQGDANSRPARSGQAIEGPAIPVTAASAVTTDIPVQLTGIGTVHAFSTVSIKSRVAGALAQVGFKQGDEIHKGDLIFLIDPRPYQAALDVSEADRDRDKALLEKAQADFQRTTELFTNNIISQSDFDQSRANVDSLKATILADEAAIANAEVQLSYCHIKSPITGRVGTLLVNEGNMVKDIDTVLAVINQIQPIYVDFAIPEEHLPAVREHMGNGKLAVEATIPNYTGHRAEGHLLLFNNQVDVTTGTILLRAEFPNADEMLWPGQFVNVALTLAMQHNAVVVPTSAVQLGQKGRYLCVVRPDDTVEFRDMEAGSSFGNETVVTRGLKAGERVITSGQLRLVPGAKVKIIQGADDSSTNAP